MYVWVFLTKVYFTILNELFFFFYTVYTSSGVVLALNAVGNLNYGASA